jgi:hypothetical protein
MYKLSIVNEVNGRTYGSEWESQSEKNEYLDKQIAKQSWGKNERHISESEMTEELRSRIISTVVIEQVEAVEYQEEVIAVEYVAPSHEVEEVLEVIGSPEIQAVEFVPYSMVHLVKADYVVTEIDLSQDVEYRNQCKVECRKKEYKSIEEVMHIILDHGIGSQEFIDYQAERQVIKEKYSKE